MNLIEVYIQEVTRRLPEKSREDIALELRSTIEDMLPDDYNEEDVKLVLEKLGNPASLASGYQDQPMYLIGPRYFDVYVTLLKMILPIAGAIALISMVATYLLDYSGEEAIINVVLAIIGEGIGTLLDVGLQVFFWLTLVFAIMERTDKGKDSEPLTASLNKWTPNDLKDIIYIPKKKAITKVEVFGSFLWTAIWATVYFYANQLAGVYEKNGDKLEFVTPVFNQEVLLSYWPMVLIAIGIEVVLAFYKLIKGQWTNKLAIFNTIYEVVASVIFIVIIINPNLFHHEFITYMTDLFTITGKQLVNWIAGGSIILFVVFAIVNIIDGFRKARIL
jgi:hypothetical protein